MGDKVTFEHVRAKYTDIELCDVRSDGYDLVSLKYDGIWCRAVSAGKTIRFFSRDGLLKRTMTVKNKLPDFELIGEFMFASQWAKTNGIEGNFYAFDIYSHKGVDLTVRPYIYRLDTMSCLVDELGEPFKKVFMRDVKDEVVPELAKQFVLPGGEYNGVFEGLVFAHSQRPGLYFSRWKKTVVVEGRVVSFIEGNGRLEKSLGAITVRLTGGEVIDVGGGFSDKLRQHIWDNVGVFTNAVIEVEGKGVFSSGKPRHPVFRRFHPEKNENLCQHLKTHGITF